MTRVGSTQSNERARVGSTQANDPIAHHAWSEAITQTLQAVASRQERPGRSDAANSLRFLADQIERGVAPAKLYAEAGAACLLGLESRLEQEDRLRRTPRFTHAAISAQAMERDDG